MGKFAETENLIGRVVAGDSLVKGDVRAADKGFPESGGFPRLLKKYIEFEPPAAIPKT